MDKLENTKNNFFKIYLKEVVPFLEKYELKRIKVNKDIKKVTLVCLLTFLISASVLYFYIKNSEASYNFAEALAKFLDEKIHVLRYFLDLRQICKTTIEMLGTVSIIFCIASLIFAPMFFISQKIEFIFLLKRKCFGKILKVFGSIAWICDNYHYAFVESHISNREMFKPIKNSTLIKSKLFDHFTLCTTRDEFTGVYKNINFKVAEKTLIRGGTSYTHSIIDKEVGIKIFTGIVLQFDLSKFNKLVTVSTKGDLTPKSNTYIKTYILYLIFTLCIICATFFAFVYGAFSTCWLFTSSLALIFLAIYFVPKKQSDNLKLEKINLEDVEFNKKFEAYAQDQIEGRCLITPAFMEKFLNLKTVFGAKNIKCSFFDNKVMFAISTSKNLFEIGSLNKSLLDFETFENFYKEINAIYEMIDYFKLGTKS